MTRMSSTFPFTFIRMAGFIPVVMKATGITVAQDPALEGETYWPAIRYLTWHLS